ncbi:acyl-CoA dehydrogenase [Mycobacterium intermedium]|uniref:Acyl-CoA dehydrogenase n=1 Tax=Mycobacterium intermedium TaxID=28445 RepID=A0A1X0FN83_MYCIE|nr:acyl-CoA dehydrogenase family protein [Mycobacterium intermedium]ORB02770.1 acyl-CoA dehydrogenase [Mycobacterium intermedium]
MTDRTGLDALRADADAWVRANLPENWPQVTESDPDAARRWYQALAGRGWTVPGWAPEHGGAGLDPAAAAVIRDVLASHDADLPVHHFVPLTLIGPAIIAWGTDEQRRRYLPGIVNGADMWCQLFSEPGAGSDLASLATRAVPTDSGTWIVDGQKVWSSFANLCQYGMLLARTDPDLPKNAGITCFLVDMRAPGVTGRPLRQMTGSEHFCEVFLERVELPADSMLGPLNGGWRVALSTLTAERSGLSETSSASGVELEPTLELARRTGAWRDDTMRDRLATLIAKERALGLTNQRLRARPDAKGSITKLLLSELSQRISELRFELAGPGAAYWEGDAGSPEAMGLLDSRRLTVAGGTSEIQRNIIAERVLGLDREPDPDRGRPWRELRRG